MSTTLRGTLEAGRLSITTLGRALGELLGDDARHHTKQVDRFVGNKKLDDADLQRRWRGHALQELSRVVVAIDWTNFDANGQSGNRVIGQSVIAGHTIGDKGRATPLVWETVEKRELKANRNRLETLVIERLHEALPENMDIIVLADRGFGDIERCAQLDKLGWYYVIRFRGVVRMSVAGEEPAPSSTFVPPAGRVKLYRSVQLTAKRAEVAGATLEKQKRMKDSWILATKLPGDLMKRSHAAFHPPTAWFGPRTSTY